MCTLIEDIGGCCTVQLPWSRQAIQSFLVMIFQFHVTSAEMNALVFLCQFMTCLYICPLLPLAFLDGNSSNFLWDVVFKFLFALYFITKKKQLYTHFQKVLLHFSFCTPLGTLLCKVIRCRNAHCMCMYASTISLCSTCYINLSFPSTFIYTLLICIYIQRCSLQVYDVDQTHSLASFR